jgi:DNA mismatch repair ATPase MutS
MAYRIAWAIGEYLHSHPHGQSKNPVRHALPRVERTKQFSFNRIKNFNVTVKEVGQQIIFLRKLVPGGSEHSFGIHVAKAGGYAAKGAKPRERDIKEAGTRAHRRRAVSRRASEKGAEASCTDCKCSL